MKSRTKEMEAIIIWDHKKVLVTGGASFIGSHLVDALVERGARVHVVDDLTSGRLVRCGRRAAAGLDDDTRRIARGCRDR